MLQMWSVVTLGELIWIIAISIDFSNGLQESYDRSSRQNPASLSGQTKHCFCHLRFRISNGMSFVENDSLPCQIMSLEDKWLNDFDILSIVRQKELDPFSFSSC